MPESLTLLAYLDPGSGAILLQCLLSGAVAVGLFFRGFFTSCWRFITRAEKRDSTLDDDSQEPVTRTE